VGICKDNRGHTSVVELLDKTGPFASELVGTGEGTVTTANGETVDTELDEVLGGFQSAFSLSDWD
jgi:hypothetical protein